MRGRDAIWRELWKFSHPVTRGIRLRIVNVKIRLTDPPFPVEIIGMKTLTVCAVVFALCSCSTVPKTESPMWAHLESERAALRANQRPANPEVYSQLMGDFNANAQTRALQGIDASLAVRGY